MIKSETNQIMYKEIRSEFEKIKIENKLLNELLSAFEKKAKTENLHSGCLVQVTDQNGGTFQGRFIRYNERRKEFIVLKDDSSEVNVTSRESINILLKGFEYITDKKLYLNELKSKELDNILKDSALPSYLSDKEYLNIKIVRISSPKLGYLIMFFEIFEYNPVLKIKVPEMYTKMGEYLQLHIIDKDIVDISPISKERYQKQE